MDLQLDSRFPLGDMFARIEDLEYQPPLLFRLFEDGYRTPFELIVASIIGGRTADELAYLAVRRVFAVARTPGDLVRLDEDELADLIFDVSYPMAKAAHVHEIAAHVRDKYSGRLPCRERVIRSLRGVGSRCANLILGLACNIPKVSVNGDVQRVTTRWGLILESGIAAAETQLCEKVPREEWLRLPLLLEPFAQHVCLKERPRCSRCPVRMYCRRVGVRDSA